jgi:transposase
MRPKGTPATLEARRIIAGRLIAEGNSLTEVAAIVGASISSVQRWKDALEAGGL